MSYDRTKRKSQYCEYILLPCIYYLLPERGINMYCTKCGALVDEKNLVCKECGELHRDIASRKESELEKFIEVTDDESSKK